MLELFLLSVLAAGGKSPAKPTSKLTVSAPKWVAPIVSAAPKPTPQQPGELPPDVDAEIKGGAMLEWPGNYRMQEYTYKREKEAWLFVQDYWNKSLPPNVEKTILAKARKEWPLKYRMQKYTIEREAEAYLRLIYGR